MKELRKILAVIIVVLLLRIGLVNAYHYFELHGGYSLSQALKVILFDPINFPVALVLTLLLGHYTSQSRLVANRNALKLLLWVLIALFSSAVSASIAISRIGEQALSITWWSLLFSALMLNAVILLSYYLWMWFRSSRTLMTKAIAKSERSQYQYAQLKRQLNPHFLFNSLNILDYLVQEQQTERASDYIKKLANIYRYLLKQEEYATIELSKELDFVDLYVDIMRERFLDGFELEVDVDERLLGRKVVPCGLQVLVENAFKHNAVNSNNKLRIAIRSEGSGFVVVSNSLHPKKSSDEQSGYGLRNLRAQYKLVASKEIVQTESDGHFIVKLPLL